VATDADGSLRSTGSDPFFLLEPETGGFPQGRCDFAFEVLPGTVPLQPVLYLDTGSDFNEAQTIRLAGGEAGLYRQVITLPPGLTRLRFDPTGLSGPLLLRNVRIVPRGGTIPEAGSSDDYPLWVRSYDTLEPADQQQITRHIATLAQCPRFIIQVDTSSDPAPATFRLTADSVEQQLYPHWEGRLPTGQSLPFLRRRRWRAGEGGDGFVLLLRSGDILAPHALYRLAVELAAHPEATALIWDEDEIEPSTGQRRAPRFRAAWSPDLMRGGDTISTALVRQSAMTAHPGLPLHDLLQLLPAKAIRHLPGVLVHHTAPLIEPAKERASYSLPAPPPLVSVIIPTRDGMALLRRTLEGVLQRTAYPAIEVLILDNGSEDPAALAYLAEVAEDPRVRVLPAPGPFNYSQLNNTGVAAARGAVVVLLNNDMDVIHPEWLTEMVSHALRPEVGAVGCKLLYENGTIQHAGIVTGMNGLAGHVFRHQDGSAPGYLGLLAHTRNVSAVTGACLVMRRAVYQEVGGLDAADLPVSYNDVDLCLKLDKAGYLIVWTPFATLYHLESVTRGADSRPENTERAQREHDTLLRRWGQRLLRDPYYSPCLTIDGESGGLAWPPRVPEPWRMLDVP
jgi:GT2 family glycosyltransferase